MIHSFQKFTVIFDFQKEVEVQEQELQKHTSHQAVEGFSLMSILI